VSGNTDVTLLLRRWRAGETAALNELIAAVYEPLQQLAAARIRREFNGSVTVDASSLLHDAYCKLSAGVDVTWVDRNHFFALSSNVMRQILVDHARKRSAEKRDSGATLLSLDDMDVASPGSQFDLLELHAFAGLTIEEIADSMNLSKATVERDFRAARAWLFRELYGDASSR
jgi:RNA polymerase sigma factor (TIGR02999 family)